MSQSLAKQETRQNGSFADGDADAESQAAELQTAIKEMVESGTLPGTMSTFLARLGIHIVEVNEQLTNLASGFDQLTTLVAQLSAVADQQGTRLAELDDKVYKLCKKFNVNVKPPLESTGASSSPAVRSEVKSPAAVVSAPGSAAKPAVDEFKEKYPNVIVVSGIRDSLAPAFELSLRVGDLVFWSMEQALYYIKYQFMKRDDLAARVKKGATINEVAQAGNIANSDEWSDVQKDACLALMQLRAMQCKEFEERIQAVEPEHSFIFGNSNSVLGSGCPRGPLLKLMPDKFTGKNLYGQWLKEFSDRYRLGLPDELPFDVKKYCIYEQAPLSDDKEKILVLADVQLSGFKGRLNTTLIVDPTMSAVEHPKDESHTAKTIIEKLPEDDNLEQCAAVVLLFGTYEVGKTPDKLETDYTHLLKTIRDKAPHVAIFVGSALPRTDKFQDQLKLTNYAIGIATRTMDDPKVVLLDITDKFAKLPNQKTLYKANGFQLTETGADKLVEILAAEVPFVTLLPPKKQQKSEVRSSGKAGDRGRNTAGGGGPSAKRPRRGSGSSSFSYRGGYSSSRGSGMASASPSGYGSAMSRPAYPQMANAGGPSYSPWSGPGTAAPVGMGGGFSTGMGGGFSGVHGTLGSQLSGQSSMRYRYDY